MRPFWLASVMVRPSVASRATGGTARPVKCRAAPSSTGAGIVDQSTLTKFCSVVARAIGLTSRPHQAAFFSGPVAFLFSLALVVQLLALGKRKLDLGSALLIEIELQRDKRHTFALDGTDQLVDLLLVQQQL